MKKRILTIDNNIFYISNKHAYDSGWRIIRYYIYGDDNGNDHEIYMEWANIGIILKNSYWYDPSLHEMYKKAYKRVEKCLKKLGELQE